MADDGPGLSDEERAHVFERFYRAPAARADHGGAGLGLSIVAAVAAAHGGRAEVGSTPGGGATFVVTLPQGLEETKDEKRPRRTGRSAG
nr:sensor histidine kinase [Saccharothrix sp. CB00851]